MTIFPVLVDRRPAYLQASGGPASLLRTPLGAGALLDWLARPVGEATNQPATILTDFEPTAAYRQQVQRSGARIAQIEALRHAGEMVSRLEPSDLLVVIDLRCVPASPPDLRRLAAKVAAERCVRHLVKMQTSQRGTKEYIELDAAGRLRRIQRYYDGVTWLQARAVIASLIPVSMLRDFPAASLANLTLLRGWLAAGVVSRDIGVPAAVFDLDEEAGLRLFCEQHVRQLGANGPPARGYTRFHAGVWVGPGCRVDERARLHAPIVLQSDVQVGAGATLIGPVLVGEGARLGRESVLAHCVVMPHAVVAQGAIVQGRVVCRDVPPGAAPAAHEDAAPARAAVYADAAASPVAPTPGADHGRRTYMAVKRVVEGVVAGLGLIVLMPLLLVTAVAIKLTSRGPVLFLHEREGKDGKPFRCCKFRTMQVDAHQQQRELYRFNDSDGPQFKLDHDPRVTPLGHWLRITNIDELPQLFNVVLGQMSLIGPRPSPFRENQICVPWREARLSVRPGITGLWQICRTDRKAGDFHQWIHYDMLYVRHMSWRLDLGILIATLVTLAGRWSVPVPWLIPAGKLREDDQADWSPRPALELPGVAAFHTPPPPVEVTAASA